MINHTAFYELRGSIESGYLITSLTTSALAVFPSIDEILPQVLSVIVFTPLVLIFILVISYIVLLISFFHKTTYTFLISIFNY